MSHQLDRMLFFRSREAMLHCSILYLRIITFIWLVSLSFSLSLPFPLSFVPSIEHWHFYRFDGWISAKGVTHGTTVSAISIFWTRLECCKILFWIFFKEMENWRICMWATNGKSWPFYLESRSIIFGRPERACKRITWHIHYRCLPWQFLTRTLDNHKTKFITEERKKYKFHLRWTAFGRKKWHYS